MDFGELAWIGGTELAKVMPPRRAIDCLRAFIESEPDPERVPERMSVSTASGELLLMPAESAEWVGIKCVSISPDNPKLGKPRVQAVYLLQDAETLSTAAILDGTALTTIRTSALSGLAVDHLAPADARRLVVFGSGPQARAHLDAICSVRPIDSVRVVARNRDSRDELVAYCKAHLVDDVETGGPESVAVADVIACCTSSRDALFDGGLPAESAVVVAVGSHEPDAREVDTVMVGRSAVVVDARACLWQAGELVIARAEGQLELGRVRSLTAVVNGAQLPPGPRLFKSVGMAWQDLPIAVAAYASHANDR